MATMVLSPRSAGTGGGILLNGPSPRSSLSPLPFPSTQRQNNLASTSSSSALSTSSSEDGTSTDASRYQANYDLASSSSSHYRAGTNATHHSSSGSAGEGTPRKIRFAPLPDPRRAVIVMDDGKEVPIPPYVSLDDDEDDEDGGGGDGQPNKISTTDIVLALNPTSPRPRSGSDLDWELVAGSAPVAGDHRPRSPAPPASLLSPTSQSNPLSPVVPPSPSSASTLSPSSPLVKKTRKLFRPFSKGSGSSLSVSNLNVSTEDVLTLGLTSVYRAATNKNKSGDDSSVNDTASERSWGAPLDRITSSSSTQSAKKSKQQRRSTGVPFRRTQSYEAQVARSKRANSTGDAPAGMARARIGQRMLNGRVYGQKRSANLFDNIKTTEPEFVEWGYGGMGAVKKTPAEGGSAVWAPLQSSQSMSNAAADDEDDGTGMGWVKRRKEQREREKKEAEEKAKREAEAAKAKTNDESANTDTGAKNAEPSMPAESPSAPDASVAEPALVSSPTAMDAPQSDPMDMARVMSPPPLEHTPSRHSEQHTIQLAAPHQSPHGHRRTHSGRTLSASHIVPSPESEGGPLQPAFLTHDHQQPAAPASDSGASLEDETEEEGTEGGEEGDEEEDEEDEPSSTEDEDEAAAEERRKTAIGAGLEKISRHKE